MNLFSEGWKGKYDLCGWTETTIVHKLPKCKKYCVGGWNWISSYWWSDAIGARNDTGWSNNNNTKTRTACYCLCTINTTTTIESTSKFETSTTITTIISTTTTTTAATTTATTTTAATQHFQELSNVKIFKSFPWWIHSIKKFHILIFPLFSSSSSYSVIGWKLQSL